MKQVVLIDDNIESMKQVVTRGTTTPVSWEGRPRMPEDCLTRQMIHTQGQWSPCSRKKTYDNQGLVCQMLEGSGTC